MLGFTEFREKDPAKDEEGGRLQGGWGRERNLAGTVYNLSYILCCVCVFFYVVTLILKLE